jgi:CRP/FNR family transcriptional regulator
MSAYYDPKCECDNCDLKSIFFNSVSMDEIEAICTRKKETDFIKGDVIFEEGDEIKDFIYLKSGLVKLFKKGNESKDQIISIAKPLDFVSLLSIFSETTYKYSVTAIEDSTICSFDIREIKQMIRENGVFALSIMEKVSRSSDRIIHDSLIIRQKNLRGRIAYILIYFAERIYNSNTCELPVSRREIGELIGMTTENVIRVLSEFRKDHILKISGKTIEIIDPEKLKKLEKLG